MKTVWGTGSIYQTGRFVIEQCYDPTNRSYSAWVPIQTHTDSTRASAEGAIVISNSDAETIVATLQTTEMQ